MTLKLYTGASVNAVSLEEAKLHVRQDQTADDDLILGLIELAGNYVEETCNLALVNQTLDLYLDAFPGGDEIILPKFPLVSVTGIYYTAEGASEATFNSSNYVVDAYRQPGRVVLDDSASWPGNELIVANGVRVRFVAGFGAGASNVPRMIRQAMLLMIGHWYENREATKEKGVLPIPMGVDSLLWNWRAKMVEF